MLCNATQYLYYYAVHNIFDALITIDMKELQIIFTYTYLIIEQPKRMNVYACQIFYRDSDNNIQFLGHRNIVSEKGYSELMRKVKNEVLAHIGVEEKSVETVNINDILIG